MTADVPVTLVVDDDRVELERWLARQSKYKGPAWTKANGEPFDIDALLAQMEAEDDAL